MSQNTFFKTLQNKINKFDKAAGSNPYNKKRLVIVWIEDSDTKNLKT